MCRSFKNLVHNRGYLVLRRSRGRQEALFTMGKYFHIIQGQEVLPVIFSALCLAARGVSAYPLKPEKSFFLTQQVE